MTRAVMPASAVTALGQKAGRDGGYMAAAVLITDYLNSHFHAGFEGQMFGLVAGALYVLLMAGWRLVRDRPKSAPSELSQEDVAAFLADWNARYVGPSAGATIIGEAPPPPRPPRPLPPDYGERGD